MEGSHFVFYPADKGLNLWVRAFVHRTGNYLLSLDLELCVYIPGDFICEIASGVESLDLFQQILCSFVDPSA